MPADPSIIGQLTNEYRRVIAGPLPDIEAQFGEAARDTPEPIETFFTRTADAQTMANERLTLQGQKRRLVEVDCADDGIPFTLDFTKSLPTAQVTNDEMSLERPMLVVGMETDLANERTNLICWG